MTRSENPTSALPSATDQTGLAKRAVIFALAILALLLALPFGAGVIAGFLEASEGGHRHDLILLAIVAIWVASIGALLGAAIKFRPFGLDETVADSVKRTRRLMFVAVLLGVFIGALMLAGDADPSQLLSATEIAVFPALIILIIWLLIAPVLTFFWWRTTDEHDRTAYSAGANLAGHFYLFVVPGWWIANRAGLMPPQNPMVIFVAVALIWTVVWLYRKYF